MSEEQPIHECSLSGLMSSERDGMELVCGHGVRLAQGARFTTTPGGPVYVIGPWQEQHPEPPTITLP